jgi:hypothetical protein
MHFYLESPPQDQTDRWSGRSFRAFSVVHPPSPANLDPTRTELDKTRFLENLWNAQAMYRTKAGQSVVLSGEETEVESRGGRVTLARTYFNIYQRTAFLQENKKASLGYVPSFSCHRLTVTSDQSCPACRFVGLSRSDTVWDQWSTVRSRSSSTYCWRALSLYSHVQ